MNDTKTTKRPFESAYCHHTDTSFLPPHPPASVKCTVLYNLHVTVHTVVVDSGRCPCTTSCSAGGSRPDRNLDDQVSKSTHGAGRCSLLRATIKEIHTLILWRRRAQWLILIDRGFMIQSMTNFWSRLSQGSLTHSQMMGITK